MKTYAIFRRSGFADAGDLKEAAQRSTHVGDVEMPNEVRWIRSYVLAEESGRVGTVCIYQAIHREAIVTHAERARLPVDEIVELLDTVIVREDPR